MKILLFQKQTFLFVWRVQSVVLGYETCSMGSLIGATWHFSLHLYDYNGSEIHSTYYPMHAFVFLFICIIIMVQKSTQLTIQ
jgi:hypothetical protein